MRFFYNETSRRSEVQVCADFIAATYEAMQKRRGPALATDILRGANLISGQGYGRLPYLVKRGFIERERNPAGSRKVIYLYKPSEAGLAWMKKVWAVHDELLETSK